MSMVNGVDFINLLSLLGFHISLILNSHNLLFSVVSHFALRQLGIKLITPNLNRIEEKHSTYVLFCNYGLTISTVLTISFLVLIYTRDSFVEIASLLSYLLYPFPYLWIVYFYRFQKQKNPGIKIGDLVLQKISNTMISLVIGAFFSLFKGFSIQIYLVVHFVIFFETFLVKKLILKHVLSRLIRTQISISSSNEVKTNRFLVWLQDKILINYSDKQFNLNFKELNQTQNQQKNKNKILLSDYNRPTCRNKQTN